MVILLHRLRAVTEEVGRDGPAKGGINAVANAAYNI
jgi:hypothetical protein